MTVLLWIVASSFIGGVLSVSCAALFALNARAHWVNSLVSYAIGALLGAAFLEILPEELKLSASVSVVSGAVLAGILLFFTLEKLLLWRHCHNSNFSSVKNNNMPANTAPLTTETLALNLSSSGNISRNAAPNNAPMA